MMAENSPTTSSELPREPDTAPAAYQMAERILDDIERAGRRARADRLAELLTALSESEQTPTS